LGLSFAAKSHHPAGIISHPAQKQISVKVSHSVTILHFQEMHQKTFERKKFFAALRDTEPMAVISKLKNIPPLVIPGNVTLELKFCSHFLIVSMLFVC